MYAILGASIPIVPAKRLLAVVDFFSDNKSAFENIVDRIFEYATKCMGEQNSNIFHKRYFHFS